MTIIYGVVKGDSIVLPEGVHLQDGTQVEVRPVTLPGEEVDEQGAEARVKQMLLEQGLITSVSPGTVPPGYWDFVPIKVEGEPLSQQIIRERR